jgi:hypothetical protein
MLVGHFTRHNVCWWDILQGIMYVGGQRFTRHNVCWWDILQGIMYVGGTFYKA